MNETQKQPEPLDAATLAFLAIVDCDPAEVRDTHSERRYARHDGHQDHNLLSLGSKQMWFGKHKGKPLKEVPNDYLLWLLSQPELDNPSVRKSRREITQYILMRLQGGPK